MKRLLNFLLLFMSVMGLKATEVSIFATCHRVGPGATPTTGPCVYEFDLFVRNNGGNELKIPTAGYRNSGDQDFSTAEGAIFQHLNWDFSRDRFGDRIVPSLSELHVAVLKAGEVARIKWQARVFLHGAVARVGVDFTVDREFAERFGLWAGSLRAEKIEIDPHTWYDDE